MRPFRSARAIRAFCLPFRSAASKFQIPLIKHRARTILPLNFPRPRKHKNIKFLSSCLNLIASNRK